MRLNRGPAAVSTMISSPISAMLALPALSLDGDPGSESESEGGDDNSGDELYCFIAKGLLLRDMAEEENTKGGIK